MIEGRGSTGGAPGEYRGSRNKGGGKRLKRAIRGALYCELGSSIRGELIGEQIREVLSGSEFVDGAEPFCHPASPANIWSGRPSMRL